MDALPPSTPDPIDVTVGLRLRAARKARGMSQDALGRDLSITFQQIQKYERGTNRISASMLVKAAQALGVSVAAILPEDEVSQPVGLPAIDLIAKMRGAEDLVDAYARIRSPRLRRSVLVLARSLATDDDPIEAAA